MHLSVIDNHVVATCVATYIFSHPCLPDGIIDIASLLVSAFQLSVPRFKPSATLQLMQSQPPSAHAATP
jgi:hypothetical protein